MNLASKYKIELPSIAKPVAGKTLVLESAKPKIRTGSATAMPASGPAMPMSINTRRSRVGARMRMTAPIVPKNPNGIGIK